MVYVKIRQSCWGLSTFHAHSLSPSMQLSFCKLHLACISTGNVDSCYNQCILEQYKFFQNSFWEQQLAVIILLPRTLKTMHFYKNDARFHTCCPCSIQLLLPSTVQKHDNILGSYFLLCLLRTLPLQKIWRWWLILFLLQITSFVT